MCCRQLTGNAGPKKSPKIRHLGTIAQLCPAISSQLRHDEVTISAIQTKISYSSEMCIGTNGKSAIAGMLATSHWRSVTLQTNTFKPHYKAGDVMDPDFS